MSNIQLFSADKWRFVTLSMDAEFVFSLLDGDTVIVTNVYRAESCSSDGMRFPSGVKSATEVSSFTRKIRENVWDVTVYRDEKRYFFFHRMVYRGCAVAASSTVTDAINVTEALMRVDSLLVSVDLDRLSAGQGQLDCDGRTIIVQSDSDFILNHTNEDNLLFINRDAFLVVTAGQDLCSVESLREPLAQLDCGLLQLEDGSGFLVTVHGEVTGRILIGYMHGSSGAEVSYLLHSSNLDKAYNLDQMFSISIAGEEGANV